MNNTRKFTGTALLAALIVVLQLVASNIHIGPFTINLSLVPMIIGAIIYGPLSGAFLGAVIATIIAIATVSGQDAGAHMMFEFNPAACITLIYLKTTLAGLVSGLIYRGFHGQDRDVFTGSRNDNIGAFLASIVAPIINTGLFSICCATIFSQVVNGWALANGYDRLLVYIITVLVGTNFLIELGINIVLTPVILRILKAIA